MRMAIVLLITLISSITGCAQGIHTWSHQECFDKSDTVAIVNSEPAVPVPSTLPILTKNKSNAVIFQQHESTLNIVSVLKGKNRPNTIVLVHLLPRPGYEGMMGYPSTTRLRQKTVTPSADDKATYLIYLSLRDDGKYEPVTGHVNPAQSVRRLVTELEDMNVSMLANPDPSFAPTDPSAPLFDAPPSN